MSPTPRDIRPRPFDTSILASTHRPRRHPSATATPTFAALPTDYEPIPTSTSRRNPW